MVDLGEGPNPSPVQPFQVHVKPALACKFHRIKVFDGEKYTTKTIAQDMADLGIAIVPNRQFSAVFAEEAGGGEGTCQFGFTADFNNNFKIGIAKKMAWEADKRIIGVKDKWIKRMTSRYVPYTHPFLDGTKWYKAFGHGYFQYMNDT